jgi:flagellar hook-length control protein FliK
MRPTLLNEVNQGVSLQALKGGGEMRLVINPPELGEIKLQIGTKNGKVDVQVTAQNESVASVIRSGSKELERSLRDESLSLTKFDVTVTPDAPVAATDTRNSLSDQFLQQNQQNGFLQAGADDKGFNRWDGNQNQRQGSNAGSMAEDQGRNTASRPDSSRTTPSRDTTRRLDVVA